MEYDPLSNEWEDKVIPFEILNKYILVSDIVGYDSRRSCCFTRGYTRLFEGTGSLVAGTSYHELKDRIQRVREIYDNNEAREKLIKPIKLRHFTSREIARMMCFPEKFSFPAHITTIQQYKMLCNSINVYVVSSLISYLVNDFCS